MTLRERQDRFIAQLAEFDRWYDKFNYLIDLSDMLPVVCPAELHPYRIDTCQSRTHFRAWPESGVLRVAGWSNAAVQRGIITAVIEMLDGIPISELASVADVYFHEKSGLIDNLTPLRKAGLEEIIRRIVVLSGQ
jgi:sulfur transfer protein SufE